MKRIFLLVVVLISMILSSNAQNKRDYNWLFGYSGHPVKGSIINFNISNEVDSIILGFNAYLGGNNTNISDKEGNLLFYANGCRVFDSTHQIMENGDSINYGETWERFCPFGNYPGVQNTLILPDPGNLGSNSQGYYVLHKRLQYEFGKQLFTPELYYSYVDMDGNEGKGKVIEKDLPAFRTTNIVNGYLTACKHANKKDWWIIQMERDTNVYFKVLLTADTIMAVDSQSIGPNYSIHSNETGQAVFSPDGSKWLMYNKQDVLLIYDFNRETGELSNLTQVEVEDNGGSHNGIVISSNSRFAYLSSVFDMYQIDLWADDIQSSLVHIAQWDGFADQGFGVTFSTAQLAPDCKKYVTSSASVRYLSVINEPNKKGKDCDFRQHAIKLPFLNYPSSFSNFPHFRIDEEDICDSTITWIPDAYIVKANNALSVYPNPASVEATISLNSDNYEYGKIRVFDINGEMIRSMEINSDATLALDVEELTPGVYVVEYVSYLSGGRDVSKLVVME